MLWMLGLWLVGQTVVLDVRLTDPEARRSMRSHLVDLVDDADLQAASGSDERQWLVRARPLRGPTLRDMPLCDLDDEGQLVLTVDGQGWILTRGTECRMGFGSGSLTESALQSALQVHSDLAPPPLVAEAADDGADDEEDSDLSEEIQQLRDRSVQQSTRHLRSVRPGALKRFAERMIGTRYRDDDEAGPGIGPGGLIRQLYLDVYGIDLGKDLVVMVQTHPKVDVDEDHPRAHLRPGDLVFTVTGGMRPRGAYVYLGAGKVIQSAKIRGVVVGKIPSDLPEHRWLIARRPLAGDVGFSSNASDPHSDNDNR